MENLITLNGSVLELNTLKETVELKVETLSKVVVNPETPTTCDELRTDTNKFIKHYVDLIDSSVKEYRKQFDPLVEILEPLKAANKELADRILEAKKNAFRKKVYDEYIFMATCSPDGNVPNFEDVYNEKWYNKTDKEWKMELAKIFGEYATNEQKTTTYLKVNCGIVDLQKLVQFLKLNNYDYEIVE